MCHHRRRPIFHILPLRPLHPPFPPHHNNNNNFIRNSEKHPPLAHHPTHPQPLRIMLRLNYNSNKIWWPLSIRTELPPQFHWNCAIKTDGLVSTCQMPVLHGLPDSMPNDRIAFGVNESSTIVVRNWPIPVPESKVDSWNVPIWMNESTSIVL